jgi:hypothetical protein
MRDHEKNLRDLRVSVSRSASAVGIDANEVDLVLAPRVGGFRAAAERRLPAGRYAGILPARVPRECLAGWKPA